MSHHRRRFLQALGAGSIAVGAAPRFVDRAAAARIITMEGAGYDIWSTRDEFHFYYAEVSGDFDVVVRNPYLENTSEFAKAGIMARETLDDDAKNVMLRHIPSNQAALQGRPAAGEDTVSTTSGATEVGEVEGGNIEADWLRLTRSGDTFEAFASTDEGESWTRIGALDTNRIELSDTVYLGLPVTSHDEGTLATAEYTALSGLDPTANRDIGDVEVAGSVSVQTGVPIVSVGDATEVVATSATLHGTLSDLGEADSASCYFEYREAGADSWSTSAATPLSDPGEFSQTLSGLAPQQEYEYRAVADTSDGDVARSQIRSFETPSIVQMQEVTDVTAHSATFHGSADLSDVDSATASFEYRELNVAEWTATDGETLTESGSFSAEATDLPARRYVEVRAVVEIDGVGTVTSEPLRFATPSTATSGPPPYSGPSSRSQFDIEDGFADAASWLDHDTPVVVVREPTREQLERAMTVDGERLVVFETSGSIHLDGGFGIHSDKLYVAGQTAPSPGITLVEGGLFLDASHVVLQHFRIRRGDDTPESGAGDCISTSEDQEHVVYDHLTATWGTDETLTLADGITNSSMSNCLVGEALRNSEFHSGGNGHSAGSLIGSGYENVSLMGNFWASNLTRNPRLQSGSSVVVNNVAYDFRNGIACSAETVSSIVGNGYIRGAVDSPVVNMFDPHEGEIYAADNYTRPDAMQFVGDDVNTVDDRPVWPEGLEAISSDRVLEHAVGNAGARPADRTYHDRRLLWNVVNWEVIGDHLPGDSGLDHAWIDHEEIIGGYPQLPENTHDLDVPDSGTWPWLRAKAREVESPPPEVSAYTEAEGVGPIDGFEDGDHEEWVGALDQYTVTADDPVAEGEFSMKNTSGSDAFLASYVDLPRYPQAGERFGAAVAPTEETSVMGVAFGMKSEENCYFLRYWPDADAVQLYKIYDDEGSDPSYEKLAQSGMVGGVTAGDTYEYVVDWGEEGHIAVELRGPDGGVAASLAAEDDTHLYGGIGTRRSGMLDDLRILPPDC